MTEVRSSASGGVGLFATQAFAVGDVILEYESPLIVLSAQDEATVSSCLQSLEPKGGRHKKQEAPPVPPSIWDTIMSPPNLPSHQMGNFRGMIQAAVSYAQQQQQPSSCCDNQTKLFQLYRPNGTLDEEKEILHVSNEALAYLEQNSKGSLKDLITNNRDRVLAVMLIWACNSFEGGIIYEKQSRINHSCNPNAIIQTNNETQCVRAAAPVDVGDEITISYLGIFLYADEQTRRDQLHKRKHFACACVRCCQTDCCPDLAAAIPCPSCHTRQGRYLDENVQYDDERTVHYAVPSTPTTTSVVCSHCHVTTTLDTKNPNHVLQLARTVSAKVACYLENEQGDDGESEKEWEEQLLQLASSVLGARHWTTNLLLLKSLDRRLKVLSTDMILTGNPPELVQVAELIDSLECVCRFVGELGLKLHIGHLLSNVVIGVARTLVALGDMKSKKYASEWAQKVIDYVESFESNDMKKVLATIQVAWQQGEDAQVSNKRAKLS